MEWFIQIKDFTPSERVAIGKAVEKEIGNRRGSNQYQKKVDSKNLCEANSGKRTDQIAAEKAGFGSKETYLRAKAVTEVMTFFL